VSYNNIVTQGKRKGEEYSPIVSFVHNFEVNIIQEVIKQEFEVLTEFLHFVVVNLYSCLEIFDVIGEAEESFGTSHKLTGVVHH